METLTAVTAPAPSWKLRADLAMRREDTRIARKHASEAAARDWTPASEKAWRGAEAWLDTCTARERAARALVIAGAAQ